MFRITDDPSSGSLVQCLVKNCMNGSIVSVDMVKVGDMAVPSYTVNYTHAQTKLNSVVLVRKRTIPTERPPPVGEVSANFCG